jgi:hypothetical protein
VLAGLAPGSKQVVQIKVEKKSLCPLLSVGVFVCKNIELQENYFFWGSATLSASPPP